MYSGVLEAHNVIIEMFHYDNGELNGADSWAHVKHNNINSSLEESCASFERSSVVLSWKGNLTRRTGMEPEGTASTQMLRSDFDVF